MISYSVTIIVIIYLHQMNSVEFVDVSVAAVLRQF